MNNESRFPAWAWGIIGAVTILAASILIISVVLGIQAGQQQIEIQRRQQIGIALQLATDAQAEGNLQSALDAYQKILLLDPSNDIAQLGIKNLLTLAQGGSVVAAGSEQSPLAEPLQGVPAPGPVGAGDAVAVGTVPTGTVVATAAATTAVGTVVPAVTSRPEVASYWDAAQVSVRAGRWQEALVNLSSLQKVDPLYRSDEVSELLYQTYTSLAAEQENQENMEGALQYYDKALLLRPDALEVQRERKLIMSYLDVLTYSGVDWPRAIELLETLYTEDPQYRDVEARLQDAHAAYGDQLAEQQQWCLALDEYESALSVRNQPDLAQRRSASQVQCEQAGNVVLAPDASGRMTATGVVTGAGAGVTPASNSAAGGGPAVGRILFSANDTVTGAQLVMQQAVGRDAPAQQLLQDAAQPALRADGTRLVFHNQRGNMAGISSYDPDTGLMLRFTQYAEDSAPSWNPQGSRVAFASNREGDRRWRIYLVWAENDGGTDTLGYGEAPAWHPTADLIAFRGCDQSGNNCGLWTMTSTGSNRAPLTTVPDDNRPSWSPDGRFVVFMSSGRDGNYEIYRLEIGSGQVTRMTNNAGLDVLPVVSPDGAWIAYASNRDGGWKIWAMPSEGGLEHIVAPLTGELSNWQEHGMQWVY
jgi:tetratricopeptide (TPR) repeat protein